MAKGLQKPNNDTEAEKKERTALYITPGLQKKVKYITLKDGGFQNDIFEKAINEYVDRWEKKNGEISI